MPPENGSPPQPLTFSHEDVVKPLLRAAHITEGRWGLYIVFGPGAANMGPDPAHISPVAMSAVLAIGLQRVVGDAPLPGLVDAARLLIVG